MNFETIISERVFLSKEWAENKEVKEFEEALVKSKGQALFLDKKDKVDSILYASFMRSGNTLMRKYLENVTGIATGSIYPNFYTMNFSLLAAGFKGETHYDDSVWLFKAHHPFLFSQVSNP